MITPTMDTDRFMTELRKRYTELLPFVREQHPQSFPEERAAEEAIAVAAAELPMHKFASMMETLGGQAKVAKALTGANH